MVISFADCVAEVNRRGEITSFKRGGMEYIWNADKEFWDWHSPILFPYIGTIKDGKTKFGGKEYLQSSRHGFARNMEFSVIEASTSHCTLGIRSNAETLKRYPFEFEFQVTYTVVKNGFNVCMAVTNRGENEMPYTIGAHPAFMLPGEFKNLELCLKVTQNARFYAADSKGLYQDEKILGIVDGQVLPLDKEIFRFDGVIFPLYGKGETFTIRDKTSGKGFNVNLYDFPVCTLWTPADKDAPFISVEPWYGVPDEIDSDGNFESKPFCRFLKQGETEKHCYSVEFID